MMDTDQVTQTPIAPARLMPVRRSVCLRRERCGLLAAACRCCGGVRFGAQGAQFRGPIGDSHEDQWARVVLTVERSRFDRSGAAGLRIIEPETEVERVRREQVHVGIEAKGFIHKNGLEESQAANAFIHQPGRL